MKSDDIKSLHQSIQKSVVFEEEKATWLSFFKGEKAFVLSMALGFVSVVSATVSFTQAMATIKGIDMDHRPVAYISGVSYVNGVVNGVPHTEFSLLIKNYGKVPITVSTREMTINLMGFDMGDVSLTGKDYYLPPGGEAKAVSKLMASSVSSDSNADGTYRYRAVFKSVFEKEEHGFRVEGGFHIRPTAATSPERITIDIASQQQW